MISIPIHKDISKYEPKIVGGLTARTLLFTTLAIVVGLVVGLFVGLVLGGDVSEFPWIFLELGATAGLWAMGYIRPLDLRFEEWASLWVRQNLTNQRLAYSSACSLGVGARERAGREERKVSEAYSKLRARKGIELWEPGR